MKKVVYLFLVATTSVFTFGSASAMSNNAIRQQQQEKYKALVKALEPAVRPVESMEQVENIAQVQGDSATLQRQLNARTQELIAITKSRDTLQEQLNAKTQELNKMSADLNVKEMEQTVASRRIEVLLKLLGKASSYIEDGHVVKNLIPTADAELSDRVMSIFGENGWDFKGGSSDISQQIDEAKDSLDDSAILQVDEEKGNVGDSSERGETLSPIVEPDPSTVSGYFTKEMARSGEELQIQEAANELSGMVRQNKFDAVKAKQECEKIKTACKKQKPKGYADLMRCKTAKACKEKLLKTLESIKKDIEGLDRDKSRSSRITALKLVAWTVCDYKGFEATSDVFDLVMKICEAAQSSDD